MLPSGWSKIKADQISLFIVENSVTILNDMESGYNSKMKLSTHLVHGSLNGFLLKYQQDGINHKFNSDMICSRTCQVIWSIKTGHCEQHPRLWPPHVRDFIWIIPELLIIKRGTGRLHVFNGPFINGIWKRKIFRTYITQYCKCDDSLGLIVNFHRPFFWKPP